MDDAIEAAENAHYVEGENTMRSLGLALLEDADDALLYKIVQDSPHYFDYARYGRTVRHDLSATTEDDESFYDNMSDEELGEEELEDRGGIAGLDPSEVAQYFDYDAYGRDSNASYDYTNGHWISLS